MKVWLFHKLWELEKRGLEWWEEGVVANMKVTYILRRCFTNMVLLMYLLYTYWALTLCNTLCLVLGLQRLDMLPAFSNCKAQQSLAFLTVYATLLVVLGLLVSPGFLIISSSAVLFTFVALHWVQCLALNRYSINVCGREFLSVEKGINHYGVSQCNR